MRPELNEYALYKGDNFIDLGTMSYLSKITGLKSNTLHYLGCPAYMKRLAKRKTTDAMVVIKIEEE